MGFAAKKSSIGISKLKLLRITISNNKVFTTLVIKNRTIHVTRLMLTSEDAFLQYGVHL